MSSIYNKLSEERKKLQEEGNLPEWYTTGGYQMFKEKYLYQASNPREQYERIARTLAAHTPDPQEWYGKFFNLLWKGWLSPSTPILANTGTSRGLTVSCAGTYIPDSLDDIYKARHEVAMLTKQGFGTASYLGDIRPRGSEISVGGKSSGVMPIIEGFQSDMEYVTQGTARRGSWAGYLPVDHGDFEEVCTYLEQNPDGNNIGWCVSNDTIGKLNDAEEESLDIYGKALKTKMTTGKGYWFFPDKANARRPQWYVDQGKMITAPQLCNEIMLYNDKDHTYTCVLSSMNLAKWDEWKDTEAVFEATVFLDAVVQEFIERGKNMKGLEKAIAFTKKSRALGLGVCGFFTHLQKNMIPAESLDAHFFNLEVFKHLNNESKRASKWLAEQWGEPEWMKGYGYANTHRIAVAPTKSTALIMGGVSEGINPDTAMVFTQRTPAGEISRVNPVLLDIMKKEGVYNKKNIDFINDKMGSVQECDFLSDEVKEVFKTAFELPQSLLLRFASTRADDIDQWQSWNAFFSADADESVIDKFHVDAFNDPKILGMYYVYSKAGVQASKDECAVCQ